MDKKNWAYFVRVHFQSVGTNCKAFTMRKIGLKKIRLVRRKKKIRTDNFVQEKLQLKFLMVGKTTVVNHF